MKKLTEEGNLNIYGNSTAGPGYEGIERYVKDDVKNPKREVEPMNKTKEATLIPYDYYNMGSTQKIWVDKDNKHPDPSRLLIWGYDKDGDIIKGDFKNRFTQSGKPITITYSVSERLTAHQEQEKRIEAIRTYIRNMNEKINENIMDFQGSFELVAKRGKDGEGVVYEFEAHEEQETNEETIFKGFVEGKSIIKKKFFGKNAEERRDEEAKKFEEKGYEVSREFKEDDKAYCFKAKKEMEGETEKKLVKEDVWNKKGEDFLSESYKNHAKRLAGTLNEGIQNRPLYEIAKEIKADWQKVYFGAVPYLDAMMQLDKITDRFYEDTAESVVAYFLANAATWKGEKAKIIKKELREMIK